jgi:hypothetical protein
MENTASNITSIVESGPLPSNGTSIVAYLKAVAWQWRLSNCLFRDRCPATGLYARLFN